MKINSFLPYKKAKRDLEFNERKGLSQFEKTLHNVIESNGKRIASCYYAVNAFALELR